MEKSEEGKQAHDKENYSFNYDFSPIAHIRTQKAILQWQIDRDKANKVNKGNAIGPFITKFFWEIF